MEIKIVFTLFTVLVGVQLSLGDKDGFSLTNEEQAQFVKAYEAYEAAGNKDVGLIDTLQAELLKLGEEFTDDELQEAYDRLNITDPSKFDPTAFLDELVEIQLEDKLEDKLEEESDVELQQGLEQEAEEEASKDNQI